MVLAAKEGEDQGSSGALEQLVGAYWQPIFGFLRGRGASEEEARDQAQGFFAYILERKFLKNIKPEGGRFRNFLLVSLRRWLKDEHQRVINVQKRSEIPWEEWHEQAAVGEAATPEQALDRDWARTLVQRSMAAVEMKWETRPALFAALRLTVESPEAVEKYALIAGRLGMTEGAVGKAAHDLRQQFAQQIHQQVRDTVARDEDVEGELRYLVRLMQD